MFNNKFPVPLEVNVDVAPESPMVTSSPANWTFPVPFGVMAIWPFAPSVIVIVPELDPELVSKVRSYAPLEVTVAPAPPVPTTTSPVPFGFMSTLIFESPPVASKIGELPEALFVMSNWFTAVLVFWKTIN